MSKSLPRQIKYPKSHPVLDELHRRMTGESPQLKLALSVEGGGMRSVVSAGMLAAMEAADIGPEYFDVIIGSSGGAFNAAYYIAGQAQFGLPSYHEHTGKDLINMKRALTRRGSYINMNHMINPVATKHKPLKFDDVIAARKLRIMATRASDREPYLFDNPSSKYELKAQLKATTAVPIAGGPAVEIDGVKYYDAGITEKRPWRTPIKNGYDVILVLATRALADTPSTGLKSHYARLGRRGLKLVAPSLTELILQDAYEKQTEAEKLITMTESPGPKPPYIFVVCPSAGEPSVGSLELARESVMAGAKLGAASLKHALQV